MGDAVATFVGCQNAVAEAAATCPECGRKGTVPVSTDAVLHKTMLCTDCSELKHGASAQALGAVGVNGQEAGVVATSDLDAPESLKSPNPPDGYSLALTCETCGGPPELILLLPDRPVKCFNCVLIAAMKRACAICGKHVTEVITRALDQQGHPNTIGTCVQCFQKAAAAQRN